MNVIPDNVRQTRLFGLASEVRRPTIKNIVDVAIRRRRLIIGSVLACLALAGLYLAVTPDSFTATTTLMTDTKQTPPSLSQVAQEPAIDPAVIESQIEVLKSDRTAQEVVDRLHLDVDPEFATVGPGILTQLAAWASNRTIPPPTAAARRMTAVENLIGKVKVARTGRSYLAQIAVTTLGAVRSAEIANAIADTYIQDQLDGRLHANQRAVNWMQQRVDEVKAQADALKSAAAQYRQDHASELAAQDPTVSGRMQYFTAAANAAQTDYTALQNRSSRLSQFIQQQTLPMTEARVLTYADPPLTRSAPKSRVVLLLAGVAGLLLGAGFTVFRELTDRRIRWAQQVKSALGLPLAGTIPVVKSGWGSAGTGTLTSLFDSHRPWHPATEALRTIKVSIDHTIRRNGGAVIGVVSPWPGEGKSTLTLNMARMLAEVGARVLVIDGDLRKPDLSAAVGTQAELGLTELIGGSASADRCLVDTGAGFDLIGHGKGSVPLHPFDVLGSHRMQGALANAQQNYDYILLDLPALLVSVDSQAVARFVDAFVLVTEFGRTTIDDVERALSTSETITNRIVSVVLNKTRTSDRNLQRRVDRRARTTTQLTPTA